MEKVILRSIEGGYDVPAWALVGWERGGQYQWRSYLLDPEFWKCLGKAEGWGYLTVSRDDWTQQPKWLYEWHRLIDHLASRKTVDSFFEELIK